MLDLLTLVAPPPIPVVIAIRLDSMIEFEVHPLDESDPLGSAGHLAVGADVDAVVVAVPALRRSSGPESGPVGTLLHLAGRRGEAATRWVDDTGAVTSLRPDPGVEGGQLHQRARAILHPPD